MSGPVRTPVHVWYHSTSYCILLHAPVQPELYAVHFYYTDMLSIAIICITLTIIICITTAAAAADLVPAFAFYKEVEPWFAT